MIGSARAFPSLRLIVWAGFVTVLVLPVVAMRFSAEVKWDAADFLAAAIMLAALGTAIEIILRFVDKKLMRVALIAGAIGCALLLWADAAVGIFV